MGVGFVLSLQTLFAAGTAAGTTISNTANADFTVGGAQQTTATSTTTFKVDRKVIFTLTRNNSDHIAASPGYGFSGVAPAVASYTLTNQSNDVLDFDLAVVNGAKPAQSGSNFAGTANNNATGLIARYDQAASGTYNSTTDTKAYVDELAADASTTVFVVASFALTGFANGDIAGVNLTATASLGGTSGSLGAHLTNDAGNADAPGTVQNLFAELSGDGGDSNYDGTISVLNSFKINAASISVNKQSYIVTDPINCTTAGLASSCTVGSNPKRVPGSVVLYEIIVTNAAGASTANATTVTDPIPTNTVYKAGSMQTDTGSGYAADDDGTSTGVADYNITNAGKVTAAFGSVAAGATKKVKFQVTVQ